MSTTSESTCLIVLKQTNQNKMKAPTLFSWNEVLDFFRFVTIWIDAKIFFTR